MMGCITSVGGSYWAMDPLYHGRTLPLQPGGGRALYVSLYRGSLLLYIPEEGRVLSFYFLLHIYRCLKPYCMTPRRSLNQQVSVWRSVFARNGTL